MKTVILRFSSIIHWRLTLSLPATLKKSSSTQHLFDFFQIAIIALLLAVAAARPQDEPIKILKQSQEHDTDSGKYSFRSVLKSQIVDLILPVWIRMD